MNTIENFLGFKIDIVRLLKITRENIALIVIIPSLLGGAEQVFRLLIIKPEMIRFFSVTQVIPDGLAFLLYIISFGIITFLFLRMYFFYLKFLKKLKLKNVGLSMMNLSAFLVLAIMTDYFMKNYVLSYKADNFLNYHNIFIWVSSFLMTIPGYFFLMYLLNAIRGRIFNFEPYFTSHQIFIGIGIPLVSIVILIFLPLYNYNEILNFRFLELKIERLYGTENFESSKVKFVNDKYVIVELKNKKNCNCGSTFNYDIYMLEDVIGKKID